MRVAVMVMMAVLPCVTGQLFDWNHAAMGFGAVFVFELNCSVADVEVLVENVVEFDENAVAGGGRNVCDGDMAGHGAGLGAETPDV